MRGKKFSMRFAAGLLGLFSLASCAEEEPENFGSVRIEVAPLGGNLDILAGTTEVVATVHYEGCLQDFYLTRNPTYTQDGTNGAPVFEEWKERLCVEDSDTPPCEVELIEQNLVEVNQIYSLSVTYNITDNDPAQIAYREFQVGPIPLEDFAACDGDGALVELRQTGLIGKNAQGDQIWRISTLPGVNSARANQGAALQVEVISTNP